MRHELVMVEIKVRCSIWRRRATRTKGVKLIFWRSLMPSIFIYSQFLNVGRTDLLCPPHHPYCNEHKKTETMMLCVHVFTHNIVVFLRFYRCLHVYWAQKGPNRDIQATKGNIFFFKCVSTETFRNRKNRFMIGVSEISEFCQIFSFKMQFESLAKRLWILNRQYSECRLWRLTWTQHDAFRCRLMTSDPSVQRAEQHGVVYLSGSLNILYKLLRMCACVACACACVCVYVCWDVCTVFAS